MDCPVLPHRDVSTHSRPKAAGSHAFSSVYTGLAFQHTAARRRLGVTRKTQNIELSFQHTAAGSIVRMSRPLKTGFNTQPPEGGWIRARWIRPFWRGFNTQPPEGGWVQVCRLMVQSNGFNTQPPEGGWYRWLAHTMMSVRFQHTAARRRLAFSLDPHNRRP